MNFIDLHAHIQFSAYDKNRDGVIKRAQEAGVKMLTVGTNFETSEAGITLSKKYPTDILATVGFHPSHFNLEWFHDKKEIKQPIKEEFDIEKLRALAQDDRVVAIGEVGLDYFRLTQPDEEKKLQKDGLVKIINLAQELQKPLMIHCRPSKGSQDAYHDLFDQFLISNFQFPIILHFFTGNLETVNRFLKLGAYFTFGGVITFARDYDEVIRAIPLENIFLETDAPYVTPEPYRGKQNEPAYVVEVAEKMAELKNITVEKLAMIQGENFEKVFRRKF